MAQFVQIHWLTLLHIIHSGLHFVGKRLTRVDRGKTSFSFPREVDLKIISRVPVMEDSEIRYVCDLLFGLFKNPNNTKSRFGHIYALSGSFFT